ncbi:hypothetical protein HY229_01525 [Candidatus Acetothermia bacterium]|nr:hypothetical protein [Candidatus Acetothermia bacterium]MBI3642770.1 hypothetical protein [Candidatus Acetothermia bacterium]
MKLKLCRAVNEQQGNGLELGLMGEILLSPQDEIIEGRLLLSAAYKWASLT